MELRLWIKHANVRIKEETSHIDGNRLIGEPLIGNMHIKERKSMNYNGFISSLGIPDMNNDGDIDYTDFFIVEEMLDEDDL